MWSGIWSSCGIGLEGSYLWGGIWFIWVSEIHCFRVARVAFSFFVLEGR